MRRGRQARLIATLSLVAFAWGGGCGSGRTTGARRNEMLENLGDNQGATLSVAVGIPDWDTGRLTLTLRGDGLVTARQERTAGDRLWEARWDKERVAAIARDMRRAGLLEIQPRDGARKPGDVPVHIELRSADEVVYAQDLWHGDRYFDVRLDDVLKRVDNLLAEISGGVLPFG